MSSSEVAAGTGGHRPRRRSSGRGRPRQARGPRQGTAGQVQRDFTFGPAQLAARAAALPVVTYPDLPVSARRDDIARAIRDHQVVIVAGETGSGKTTQLPKICLELGRGISAMIGHTQPRRLAARAVAERIADELGQKVGKEAGEVVGYQVRFTDEVGPTTLIKLMTDGILLAEMGTDPLLRRYDTIIVDEAHERSLNIDFILGYLGRILPQRPDLKVIITSATIDSQRFADHFAKQTGQPVPVIEVSGRAYPVEVRYRPLSADLAKSDEDEGAVKDSALTPSLGTALHPEPNPGELATYGYGLGDDLDIESALVHAVDELLTEERGDILVFLPGERDIIEAEQALKEHLGRRYVADERDAHGYDGVQILPLFARLSAADQHRIYAPHSVQRVILSTNIAETSLTVPGIRYVIDAGLARISRFSNKTKVQRLPIEPVSKASASQRAGRAGRTSEGIAIRLYSERDFERRPHYTEPEILRTSLASVILQMSALGLGEVKNFPFLDAPNPRAVRDGVQLLTEIGALDAKEKITPLGRRLATLPIDPRLGRMLVEADKNGCASDVLVIVAALSIQDPRERPLEMQEAADQAHRRYADPTSDFITYLNMWRYLGVRARDLSGSAFRRLCKREFFHYLRYREWRDIVGQLRQMCRQVGIRVEPLGLPSPTFINSLRDEANHVARAVIEYGQGTKTVDADEVHRAMLSGLLSNIGSWDEAKREYAGARGSRFTIWPGSALKKRRPEWIMAAELVETSRLFARTVAGIKPEWIEAYAGDLAKRSYSEPVWSRARGCAQVTEKVTLYGLTLVANRTVPLTRLGDTVLGRDWGGTAADSLEELATVPTSLSARDLAREMFITHALVEGDWRENHLGFVKHNKDIMAEAEDISKRMRDPSLVPDEATRYRFFASRVPVSATSSAAFLKWWKTQRLETPKLLNYTLEELLPSGALLDPQAFPSTWKSGDLELEIRYAFTPGSQEDGVTVVIPLAILPRVKDIGFDWLVPGLLEDLCVAMIRALPKNKRRFLAPATQTGKEVAEAVRLRRDQPPGTIGVETQEGATEETNPYSLEASLDRLRSWGAQSGSVSPQSAPAVPPRKTEQPRTSQPGHQPTFAQTFAVVVRERNGIDLTPEDLQEAQRHLPPHLRIGFNVLDDRGALIGASESLTELQRRFAKKATVALQSSVHEAMEAARRKTERSRLKGDVAGEVPSPTTPVTPPKDGEVARQKEVGLRTRLLGELRLPIGRVTSRWSGNQALLLAGSPYPDTAALVEDAQVAAVLALIDQAPKQMRQADYAELQAWMRPRFEDEVYSILLRVTREVEAYAALQDACQKHPQDALKYVRREAVRHAKTLFHDGYLGSQDPALAPHIARYLLADAERVKRASRGGGELLRDRRNSEEIAEVERALTRVEQTLAGRVYNPADARELSEVRLLIEELRVSLFAQSLGTSTRVSSQRVLRRLETLERP
ncbi:DUF3418 domain-containing protein [Actinomyces minihominis]|uniref:DUF3418 domain-containing protein n=1 Tax=Actinomyces minihominis TaxID=2002838 RepID=UPI000C088383|nr:DUF3418 domain-containing protein [Actinomyces minihominis]